MYFKTKPMKLYFQKNHAICYPKSWHLDYMKETGLTELELFEADPEKVPGFFWCSEVGEPSEDGYCGKICDDYAPKNGKSGMCRHRSNNFHQPGKKVILTINGKIRSIK